MRERIIDEQKAPIDYEKLRREAKQLLTGDFPVPNMSFLHTLYSDVGYIIGDEERHAETLISLFDKVCPKMAVSRNGVEDSGVTHKRKKEKEKSFAEWYAGWDKHIRES